MSLAGQGRVSFSLRATIQAFSVVSTEIPTSRKSGEKWGTPVGRASDLGDATRRWKRRAIFGCPYGTGPREILSEGNDTGFRCLDEGILTSRKIGETWGTRLCCR